MNPDEELVDYYDADGNVIGFCTRREADDKNYTYPNAIVFVFTTKQQVWVQRRSFNKRHYPGLWDPSACGALAHGEDPVLAAQRELQEEIGLACDLTFVEAFLNTFPSEDGTETRSRMSHLFIGTCDDTPEWNDEVDAVAAWGIDELLAELAKNPQDFVPSFDVEIEKAVAAYAKL